MKIGLTGPIGAGKSQVAAIWESCGAAIVEGDEIGRRVVEDDPGVRKALVARFGDGIVDATGRIVRRELGRIAFETLEAQRALTDITFPALYELAKREMSRLEKNVPAVVFDAALIFEWGVEKEFDAIVVVTASERKLVARAAARMRISVEEAQRRLARQIDPEEKARRSDYLIVNDGSEENLEARAMEIWRAVLDRGEVK